MVGVAPCLLCVSQAVEACILAQCPQLGSFQHRMLLPLQFLRCQRKDVNIREEDSFKFTVDAMQDEKVIAVMPISRSFWFAGEDHVQTSFSFGDILLSQLSVPYICQYSKSTGLFAVAMLFSHTSCDQSVEACRPVKVPPQREEQVRAQRRAEELDKQKRAAEEAETTNAEKQVRLSVWIIVVH